MRGRASVFDPRCRDPHDSHEANCTGVESELSEQAMFSCLPPPMPDFAAAFRLLFFIIMLTPSEKWDSLPLPLPLPLHSHCDYTPPSPYHRLDVRRG